MRNTALLSISTPKPFHKYCRIQDEEEECDESAESLLLQENVNKLLDFDIQGPGRRNIFPDKQEPCQRIRRSIITRALRNVISSTPMPTKANGHFFSTDGSLNLSPINSENDEHSVREEIKNTIFTEPSQPQHVDPNIISISSESSHTKYESSDNAKSKDLLSKLKTHYTRSQRRKLGEKISPKMTKSDKEHIHSIGDECKSREVTVNGINQTHIVLPELIVTSTNDTGLNANDKVDTNLTKNDPCNEVTAETSKVIAPKSDKINKNPSKSLHQTKADDRTLDRIELESCEKTNKSTKYDSKSPCRTKSDDRTSNMIELKSSEKANKSTKHASKSPCRTKSDDRISNKIELKSSEKAKKVSKNASKSPNRIKADDKITYNSKPKSAEKFSKISKNISVSPNRIKTIEKSYQTDVVNSESHFFDEESSNINSKPEQSLKSRKNHQCGSNLTVPDIHRSSYTLKNSVNSVCLSPIQESQDFKTPTRRDNCVRTASVSLRISRRNVTLRKSSQIDSRQQVTIEQNNVGIEYQSEVGIKRLKNLEEKSSKIPVLRTRSKSREKPDELESQTRSGSSGENIHSINNSNKENKDALLSSPPKPAPRRRKKKKSAFEKSSEKNHDVQNIVEGVTSPLHTACSALVGFKTTDVFQKHFVDTGSSPNISLRAIRDPAATQSIATSTVEQVAKSSVLPEKKQSLTLCSLKRKSFSAPKRVVDAAVSPFIFFSSSSSTEKEERCKRLDSIITQMTNQQSPCNSSKVQSLEGSFNPLSNLDHETHHKQVQTSLRKSGKTKRKSGSNKKRCARNIFTKTVAETQTSTNNNDDTSLSSGMTDSSKMLEEFDRNNLFNSLEEGLISHHSFSSSENCNYSEVTDQQGPWRYEDQAEQVESKSSKQISVKLNFLESAIQIEEEKTLLNEKGSDSTFDPSSSFFEDSGEEINCIDKNKKKELPRLKSKSTFRDYTHKSTKQKAVGDSRTLVEKNMDSSSELGSDHSVCDRDIEGFNHPKRMSLENEPQEENTEKDVEPEENTLIDIDSGLQRSQIHETTTSTAEKGNSEDNSITPQTSKLVTPSEIISEKQDPMLLKRKSDVMKQKNYELPTESPTGNAEKENEFHRIIQETTYPSRPQKSVINQCFENQLGNALNDEKDQGKEQNTYGSSRSRISHSGNISNLANDSDNISEMNQSKKNVSTHSFIENNTNSQEEGSETDVNQIQKETATRKKKGSKTSFSAKTKFISNSASKNQNMFEIATPRGRNNEETDSREQNAKHWSPAQFDLNTDNCPIKSLEVSPSHENLEQHASVNCPSHTAKQRKLSVMLRKLSEESLQRKWSTIHKILDGKVEDVPELHSNKNAPNSRKQVESINDFDVLINHALTTNTPKSPNTKEESHTKNLESENKKEEEPVFKVPKTKSRKITKKRLFPSSDDDISLSSEDSSRTGTRRSTRDRRPPKRRFVMDQMIKPVKETYKSRTKQKPVKRYPVASDEEQEESTNKQDASRKKDQQKTQTTGKRGRPKKVTPLPVYNSDKDEDNLTEVPETIKKRLKTKRTAALNSPVNEDDSSKGSETTSEKPKKNKKSTSNSVKDGDNSINQPKTEIKRPRTNNKKKLNSLENADNSTNGPETMSKITRLDKETTSVSTEKNLDHMHSIAGFINDNEIDTPSHIQKDLNHFEIGEECQDLDDEMFLRIPNPQNMISQDSGTSTLLKSNTFDVSNLPSTKRPRKVNKPNEKISKVVSETVSVSPRKEVNIHDEKDRMMKRNSLVDNECVDIWSGSELVRLKYVQNDVQFQKCQDQVSLTNFIRGTNGTTMGYLKLPANGMKPVHIAKKHALCYFVLEGEGRIQVHNRTSKVEKLSHFVIPLGVEYAIMNDGKDDMLLACVRVEGT